MLFGVILSDFLGQSFLGAAVSFMRLGILGTSIVWDNLKKQSEINFKKKLLLGDWALVQDTDIFSKLMKF